jgi:hypothetical protein
LGLVLVSEAGAATFTVDANQSIVTLSGSVAGSELREQGPGSLGTRLEGALQIDATATELTITGGSLDAATNGVWQPGVGGSSGAAPADFGAQANSFLGTIRGALRDVIIDVSSGPRPVQNGQFNAASIEFAFPTNALSTIDYNAGFAGTGSRPLVAESTNNAATTGTISGAAGSRVINLNVDATFTMSLLTDGDTILRVQGLIVAREGTNSIPSTSPVFTRVEWLTNQVRLTADQVTAGASLVSSTNLTAWLPKQAQATSVDADTRIFLVPVTGPKEFYRIVQ